MAGSGKQYTMTFLLKAAADSSYQAAFSKAKQELNTYQKEIQANNALLRDISAYQKQEQAVQRASEKVAEKAQKLREVQTAAAAAGNAAGQHSAAELKAEAALKNANEQLKQQEEKLRQQASALQQAGVNTENLSGEQQRLTQATEQTKRAQEELAEEQNKMIDQVANMEALAAEAYIAAQGVEKLAQAWKACIDAASGFQYAMSAVEAVSGASKQEMTQLSAMAKDIGANTIYTATEIGQAMEYMGLAGWSAQEMMDGMPAVANLTAAAGENLGRVCDIVTDSMQALGYGTEDTARFCDVLASTVTNANTTVDLMGDTLKYVSSTAGALGYSIEDVSTAIAAMANNGIKGSMNGTALRNILANLAAPSEAAAKALDELGVSLTNSDGDVKELDATVTNLRNAFSGLSDAEKVAYASTIAGKRGMAGLLAIVNTTQTEYDRLGEVISDCDGAAEKMAGIRLDNLQGNVVILESAFDALKTSIGEVFLDGLGSGAQTLTQMTNAANSFVKENKEVVAGATAAATAFGIMTVSIGGTATAVKLFNIIFKGSALANPAMWGFMAATAGIAGVAIAIANAAENAESAGEKVGRLNEEISEMTDNQALIDEYQELSEALEKGELSAEEMEAADQRLYEIEQQLAELYPEQLGGIDAKTDAYSAQLEVLERLTEAEKNIKIAEVVSAAEDSAKELADAQEQMAYAQERAGQAQENMMKALNATDLSYARDELQKALNLLQQDVSGGKVTIDTDEYKNRLQELSDMASAMKGEDVQFTHHAGAEQFLARFDDSSMDPTAMAGKWGEVYKEAQGQAEEYRSTVDELSAGFRLLVENGVMPANEVFTNYGVTMSDMGITLEDVGTRIANGSITAEDAMKRYDMSMEEVNRYVQGYYQRTEQAAKTTEDMADAQELSYKKMLQVSHAVAAATDETLNKAEKEEAAAAAAKIFGLEVDELNGYLEEQEEYSKNVKAACEAVENGYLSAETAAERFGVTAGAMDAYTASQNIEALTKKLEELQEAYDEAYSSAYTSIMGQLSLTEALKSDAERDVATVAGATKNLEQSARYIDEYKAALDVLNGYHLSADFISSFCDESAEGMATAIDLANDLKSMAPGAAQEAATGMQNAFNDAGGASNSAATEIAKAKTNFDIASKAIQNEITQCEQIVGQEMGQMVASMNKSSQARSNGAATAMAYVQGIRSQISAARAAAEALAAAGTPKSAGASTSSTSRGSSGSKTGGGKAHGGFTNGPELAGEDPRYPTEAVISFNPAYRDENIAYLQRAAEMLGVSTGGAMEYMNGSQESGVGSGYQFGGFTDLGYAALTRARLDASAYSREAPTYMGGGAAGTIVNISVNNQQKLSFQAGDSRGKLLALLRDCDEELVDLISGVIQEVKTNEERTKYGR